MPLRVAIAGALPLLAGAGCGDAPVAFHPGDRIPLGPYGVTITHVEARQAEAPVSDAARRAPAAPTEIAVYVSLDGPLTFRDAREFERVTGAGHATLIDVKDHRFRARGRWSAELYGDLPQHGVLHHRLSRGELDAEEQRQKSLVNGLRGLTQGNFPDQCVYVFEVPADDYGFTLELRNADWRAGQPRLAAIDLGR